MAKESPRGPLEPIVGRRVPQDRKWSEYPLGTKAHACGGGYWERVNTGWKWCTGATFPTPGGDACGDCVEPPNAALSGSGAGK